MDFLPDSHLLYIIVIRKGSFCFGTFGLGLKLHKLTVTFDSLHCAELIYECYAILCDVKNVENLADRQQIKIMTMATNVDKY